ncbi:hypothetical protein AVEN_171655-1 [Araneus ventricosus]|uniref:Uncharacterized protein n=1 Tax=Araneus ventricosus TaxID=182803 RepID=A0A4Y2I5M5_ARAVE|nr:hypothetical protein AVEN_171655-1 [Araneus ventricosus]
MTVIRIAAILEPSKMSDIWRLFGWLARFQSLARNRTLFLSLTKANQELEAEIPKLMKFIIFNTCIPILEAICESWGSTINKIVQKRPTASDGDDAAVGTTDKRMYLFHWCTTWP